jgi:aminoglycoside 3-N-acetyltransferase
MPEVEMSVTLKDLQKDLQRLKVKGPVIVHASLSSFGQVDGGAQTVVEALLAVFQTVVVPAFTYKTMIYPLIGPAENGIVYGVNQDHNRMAEFFTPDMPVDPLMGIIPETLRRHPNAKRTKHPILSFAGVNADFALGAQSMAEPFSPIGALAKHGGWVLLLGVDHTVNTSIHYAEGLAGRKRFIRWALTLKGVCECPNFPGCSAGFQAIAPVLERSTRRVQIGNAAIQAVPLRLLCDMVVARIKKDPLALLCQQEDCGRCNQIRALV